MVDLQTHRHLVIIPLELSGWPPRGFYPPLGSTDLTFLVQAVSSFLLWRISWFHSDKPSLKFSSYRWLDGSIFLIYLLSFQFYWNIIDIQHCISLGGQDNYLTYIHHIMSSIMFSEHSSYHVDTKLKKKVFLPCDENS